MGSARPLLMIPGPIEISPAVREACDGPPPGHLAPALIQAFGRSLEAMRRIWRASPRSQPFLVAGSGTTAMEMAVANLVEEGARAVVVRTGYFSDRIAEMLRRTGAVVSVVDAPPGDAPPLEAVARAMKETDGPVRLLVATHVDTSTGVRVDPRPLAGLAREHDALSLFDGVCATAAERFDMDAWGADVYLTASQKAIGLPPGLALLVAGERALAARATRRSSPPPLALDWEAWQPVMQAYEERRPSYFATPATGLVRGLAVGLEEILDQGVEQRVAMHERAARSMRRAWEILGLRCLPARPDAAANTLSALYYPDGVDASLVGRIAGHGVVVAGGLLPDLAPSYFRVGHMGYAAGQADMLRRTVEAVALGLRDAGHPADVDAAVGAVDV